MCGIALNILISVLYLQSFIKDLIFLRVNYIIVTIDKFLRELLSILKNYSVESILYLGMPAQEIIPNELPDVSSSKIHNEILNVVKMEVLN